MTLLEKDRERRYRSAEEVAESLSRWLAHIQQPDVIARPGISESGFVGSLFDWRPRYEVF